MAITCLIQDQNDVVVIRLGRQYGRRLFVSVINFHAIFANFVVNDREITLKGLDDSFQPALLCSAGQGQLHFLQN